MTSRREFLRGLAYGSVTTPVAFRDGWERVIEDATRGLDRRSAAEIASDEDFWLEIQRGFTVDRTLINLNNGGVSPSPRVASSSTRSQPSRNATGVVTEPYANPRRNSRRDVMTTSLGR